MNYLTKAIVVTLIPFIVLNLCLPQISSAEQGHVLADAKTTKAQPEVLATPEEDIPVEKVEKGGVSWLWIILGIVAVGGIAAAAGGGGGGGGGGSTGGGGGGGGGGGSTGTITAAW